MLSYKSKQNMYISWKTRGTAHTAYLVKSVRGVDGKRHYPIYTKLGNFLPGVVNRSDFIQSAINHINNVLEDTRSVGYKAEERDSLRSRLIANLQNKVDQLLVTC